MAGCSNYKRFSLVVAVTRNNGIGYKMGLPWPRIKTDLKFLNDITTNTVDPKKQNAVVMGRLTWESVPAKHRPMKGRFNVVLSSRPSSDFVSADLVCSSLQSCVESLSTPPLSDKIENVFILGGTSVYEEAMLSPLCDKVYYTDVMQEFPCDAFFRWPNKEDYKLVDDPVVPQGLFEENGVKYQFLVYQHNTTLSSAI